MQKNALPIRLRVGLKKACCLSSMRRGRRELRQRGERRRYILNREVCQSLVQFFDCTYIIPQFSKRYNVI